ncbi:MAG: DinB family protein [Balneolaceae bacterium]|nr:DinB family protein [Balneolaceae bacterium]MBO6546729.1 DinB family protein [Balneolaceae bacterium]MBO6649087.1 DinB family protein [Balneolaceae bacterium]
MLSQTLSELFERDIQKIKTEVEAYSSEEAIWKKADGITNCGGNLSLHLSGNLQHFFGAVLGGTDYVRDREFEFGGKVTRQELLDDLDAATISVKDTLAGMTNEDFQKDYPIEIYGGTVKTEWFLLHLYSHLSYHLGQINYHRRLLDK